MDFRKPRPGPIDPKSCAACALIADIAREAVETMNLDLARDFVELGARHALLGHPDDDRLDRSGFGFL
ncbi:hypothetical protein ACFYM2_29360 [Streptomyces sp. NPDC006711]|uniref:hypothetical protein n=1 Tax=Streptomyces sp. NPDC006711 TaxID=3364762 RepID=UPI0036BCD996